MFRRTAANSGAGRYQGDGPTSWFGDGCRRWPHRSRVLIPQHYLYPRRSIGNDLDRPQIIRLRGRFETRGVLPIPQVSVSRNIRLVLVLTKWFRLDVPYDCSVELSHLGYQFFTDIFMMFDKDRDGSLNSTELNELFSTSPGNPWTVQKFVDATVADEAGAVTLQGWLAQWRCARSLGSVCAVPQLTVAKHDDAVGPQDYFGAPSIPWLPR